MAKCIICVGMCARAYMSACAFVSVKVGGLRCCRPSKSAHFDPPRWQTVMPVTILWCMDPKEAFQCAHTLFSVRFLKCKQHAQPPLPHTHAAYAQKHTGQETVESLRAELERYSIYWLY